MVDSTEDAGSLQATGDAATFAQTAMNGFSDAASNARGILDSLNNKIIQFKGNLDINNSLTQQQATTFGLLSTAVLGTRKAFDNLSGIDTSSLNTFSSQINDLQRTILQDSSLATMTDKAIKMGNALGISSEKMQSLLKQGAGAVFDYANSLAESADNGLRLQNAYIQLSAATGNLSSVYAAAGPNLDKINLLLNQQQKMITDSSAATGISAEVISQYYAQLASVPKALTSTVSGIGSTTRETGMLTAAIRVATGSGRSFTDVMDDMKVAFRNYNLTGEDALKFTTRISELSNKFGVELTDVREVLRSTSDQFKIFGNEAEGAANIYNSYLGALESTGISGHAAIDVVRGMVNGIKELGIAQKGFLSAQTGGPGGLMGAFQIEKDLREGKIDQVFDRVRKSLGKQFGSIVTLEEASQSQAAAAQLTKQIQILRQGALGSFAKDDQSAIRILESFKAREQGKNVPTDLSQTLVQDTAKAGLNIEQKSYTELTRIRSLIEAARFAAIPSNLGLLENAASAGTGTPGVPGAQAFQLRDDLKQNMVNATIESGKTSIDYANDLVNKFAKDRSGQFSAQIIRNFQKFYDQLTPAIKAPLEEITNLISSGDTQGAANTYNEYLTKLHGAERDHFTNAFNQLSQGTMTAGATVGEAAQSTVNNKNINTSNAASITSAQRPTPAANGGHLGDITVHVEGYCVNCGDKMKNTAQSYAVNVGQRVEK